MAASRLLRVIAFTGLTTADAMDRIEKGKGRGTRPPPCFGFTSDTSRNPCQGLKLARTDAKGQGKRRAAPPEGCSNLVAPERALLTGAGTGRKAGASEMNQRAKGQGMNQALRRGFALTVESCLLQRAEKSFPFKLFRRSCNSRVFGNLQQSSYSKPCPPAVVDFLFSREPSAATREPNRFLA
jgi:hypothetical protein